ncbi:glutamine amidotransferase, class I [Rhodobacterales bacterium HTCC2150]|nr:glutamine amidotransferase, class I [Rhodobacterales bacterium HTCC2150] [Rhodobacteraceae bacterium HTCC2150]
MKIGILQCGHAIDEVLDTFGDYDRWFQTLLSDQGFEFETYNVVDMEFPASINDCDGWLLTGSRHGAYEDHPFIPPLSEMVREAYSKHIPIVGVCFGHQLIAQALGGKVEKFKEGWAVGHQTYNWSGLGDVSMNAWHQDQVTQLPDGATPIATSDFCEYAALVYDDRAWTVQAHPEISNPIASDYLDIRGKQATYPDEVIAEAKTKTTQLIDDNTIADEIAGFFRMKNEKNKGENNV